MTNHLHYLRISFLFFSYIWTLLLAKPSQATLLRSGGMVLLARNRSPISPDLSSVAWLGLAK